jgi:hypothetical protein
VRTTLGAKARFSFSALAARLKAGPFQTNLHPFEKPISHF